MCEFFYFFLEGTSVKQKNTSDLEIMLLHVYIYINIYIYKYLNINVYIYIHIFVDIHLIFLPLSMLKMTSCQKLQAKKVVLESLNRTTQSPVKNVKGQRSWKVRPQHGLSKELPWRAEGFVQKRLRYPP